jgi:hypothetical protein
MKIIETHPVGRAPLGDNQNQNRARQITNEKTVPIRIVALKQQTFNKLDDTERETKSKKRMTNGISIFKQRACCC